MIVISNFRLPEIELPTEEILKEDDDSVSAAFTVIRNAYERAQKRTREIIKAYNELESIARNILKEHHEDPDESSKNDPGKLLIDKNDSGKLLITKNDPGKLLVDKNVPGKSFVDKNVSEKLLTGKNIPGKSLIDKNTLENNSSTPILASCKQNNSDKEQTDIEMIDLTAIFDFDRVEETAESRLREISPELGDRRQRSIKKHIATSSQNDLKQKVEEEMEKTALKTKRIANKHGSTSENQRIAGNEENRPPFRDSSLNNSSNNDSMLSTNESRSIAKIGFAKTLYSIEWSKKLNGKPSKQSELIFQPVATKSNIRSTEKIITKSTIFGHYGGKLFDEDYQSKKKMKVGENSGQSKEQSNAKIMKDSTESGEKAAVGIDKIKSNEQSETQMETSMIIPTASQIDETARSLFDDEDVDDFGVSHNILNVCVRSPILADLAQEVKSKDNIARNKISDGIACASNASQFTQSTHSIDETFFAPAELMEFKSEVEEKIVMNTPVAGCSTLAKANDARKNNRVWKRKSEEETIDPDKELGDLGLQDINWDTEISNDDWTSSNRPINNSFDIPPEKNSPEYAHYGKVERNKVKRSKLRGWECRDCENYYGEMNLSDEELRKRKNACSRHKSKYDPRYCTPAGFWNPEFPETADSSDSS